MSTIRDTTRQADRLASLNIERAAGSDGWSFVERVRPGEAQAALDRWCREFPGQEFRLVRREVLVRQMAAGDGSIGSVHPGGMPAVTPAEAAELDASRAGMDLLKAVDQARREWRQRVMRSYEKMLAGEPWDQSGQAKVSNALAELPTHEVRGCYGIKTFENIPQALTAHPPPSPAEGNAVPVMHNMVYEPKAQADQAQGKPADPEGVHGKAMSRLLDQLPAARAADPGASPDSCGASNSCGASVGHDSRDGEGKSWRDRGSML